MTILKRVTTICVIGFAVVSIFGRTEVVAGQVGDSELDSALLGQSSKTMRTTTQKVWLVRSPRHPETTIITKLPLHTEVTVVGTTPGWLRVEVAGKSAPSGYVLKTLLESIETSSENDAASPRASAPIPEAPSVAAEVKTPAAPIPAPALTPDAESSVDASKDAPPAPPVSAEAVRAEMVLPTPLAVSAPRPPVPSLYPLPSSNPVLDGVSPSGIADTSLPWPWLAVIIALLVIAGVIWRYRSVNAGGSGEDCSALVELRRVQVARRTFVSLVRAPGVLLVLSVCPEGIALVTTLPVDAEPSTRDIEHAMRTAPAHPNRRSSHGSSGFELQLSQALGDFLPEH